MAAPPYLRRKYFVKKRFQLKYIGAIFLFTVIVVIISGYTVFYTGWSAFGEKLSNVYPQGRFIAVLKEVNTNLIRNLLLGMPVLVFFGIMFSHRIAGPLVRIEKVLYEIGRGNLGINIQLRKRDELKDVAEIINAMALSLKENISESKHILEEAIAKMETIKEYSLNTGNNELNKSIVEVEEKISNIKKLLEFYKSS